MERRDLLRRAGRLGLATAAGWLAAACGALAPSPSASGGPLASASPEPSAGGPFSTPPTAATPSAGTPSGVPAVRDNPIVRENARGGSRDWHLSTRASAVAGYTNRVSVAPGETLALHVRAGSEFDINWFRLGWYRGDGARRVRVDEPLSARAGGPVTVDPATNMAETLWPAAIELTVPQDWTSGMYLAVITPKVGGSAYAPFVVRPAPSDGAPVLFVSAAATWQAYNPWGGADLYGALRGDLPQTVRANRAYRVSFDRPYAQDHGAGYLNRWELPFMRWQEREGRDVAYAADVDLETHPEVLANRRLIVFAGHHEYWSRPMRSALEAAVASGTNVAFLSANEVYWQVRFEPSTLGPARRMTCYKSAGLDPLHSVQPALTTCRWRESPVNDPEATLVGQMYGHVLRRPSDWVVAGASHWLYDGTRLDVGDRLVNLVGQEYDTYFPQFGHPGTEILARSPVATVIRATEESVLPSPSVHTATAYVADSGATVLAAGTFQWSWALDSVVHRAYHGVVTPYDERVVRMTRNVFDRLGDGPG